MPVSILIPAPLRQHVAGARRIEVHAATVAEALARLAEQSTQLRALLFDDAGHLSDSVDLLLGNRQVPHQAPSLAAWTLGEGDVLDLVWAGVEQGTEPRLSTDETRRYSRHLIMPEVTLQGQQRLKSSRVLCIGAGGLGSSLTLYLAAAGVGHLGLVDFDTVDLTNLQRQVLYSTADVGRAKLEAAKERLSRLNPHIEIVTHPVRLAAANAMDLLRGYDVVADGSDNFATRYLVNDACVLLGKPNVYASVYRFEGQITVFDARRGPCYRCLFPQAPSPGLAPSCAEGGVLGVLPGILGAMQGLEVLKAILGVGEPLIGRLIAFDGSAFTCRELAVPKRADCAVCGAAPTITMPLELDVDRQPCATGVAADGTRVSSLTVEELHGLRQAGRPVNLLDVRERHEHAIAPIPGAVALPLSELPTRLRELDPTEPYVLYCHRGPRSVQAYHLLRQAGFDRLQVLDGGVDAWAARIDRSLARY